MQVTIGPRWTEPTVHEVRVSTNNGHNWSVAFYGHLNHCTILAGAYVQIGYEMVVQKEWRKP